MLAEYNKSAVAERFSRGSERYEQLATVQQQSANLLLARLKAQHTFELAEPNRGSKCILDLGCGPGGQAEALKCYAKNYVGIDIAPGMLAQAALNNSENTAFIRADMEKLPFQAQQFDFIYSNMAVQWSNSPLELLQELRRVIKDGGMIAVSTVLNDSLQPLAKLRSDFNEQRISGVNQQFELSDWVSWGRSAGLDCIHAEVEELCGWFTDVPSLLRSVSAIGADHQRAGHTKKLSIREYTALQQSYEQFRTKAGLPLKYQVGILVFKK